MTNYQLVTFNDTIREEFFSFCKEASLQKDPAAVNMWDNNWQDRTYTLPYLLINTDRFKNNNGKFFVLYNHNTIVGCGGIYISSFSNNIALAGVRTWISSDCRHLGLSREYLLPAQKEWAIAQNLQAIALTFNEYNKNMISLWKRIRLGEKRSARESKHIFYNGLIELGFPVNIQYTKQWVAYELLDLNFSFDWTAIKWK